MVNKTQELWQDVQSILKEKLGDHAFRTWLKTTRLSHLEDGKAVLSVSSNLARDWIIERYSSIIAGAIKQVSGCDVQLEVEVSKQSIDEQPIAPNSTSVGFRSNTTSSSIESNLNPRFTFSTFVVGNNSRFAHAACKAVAEKPGKAYNPLFIYSGVGLGKTHLMHAIGHEIVSRYNDKKVLYITAEQFMNEVVLSIQRAQTQALRSKFRGLDVLLIDDIEFLGGKDRTKEEFFHTFNALHDIDKQIVLTSDRPPKEIPLIEDRLRSRFEWGLTVEIKPPDFETRLAILHAKVAAEHIDISNDVLRLMASSISSNIRELEGALRRIIAYSLMSGEKVTTDIAQSLISDMVSKRVQKSIHADDIIKAVASYFGVAPSELKGVTRHKQVVTARHVAMYLIREYTGVSLPHLGKLFGGKDHTTVIHAIEKVKQQMDKDNDIRNAIDNLRKHLENNV